MNEEIFKDKTIFCDLDGTLLEDKMRHYRCYLDIVALYGGTPIGLDEYWNDKRNKVKRTILLEKTNFGSTYDVFYNEWMQRIEQKEYLKYEVLKPRIKMVLSYLTQFVEQLNLVTMRNNKKNLIDQIESLDLESYFNHIYIGNPVQKKKKMDLVDKYYGVLGLVIGDTEDDMLLAEKIGSPFLAVTNGLRTPKYLKANYYLKELEEILL